MEDDDDAHLEDDDDAQLLISYNRRPEHEACLAEIFRTEVDDLIARLAIKRYDQAGFIPSEVLVTLARSHYGGSARVRNAVALALNDRLIIELRHFVNRNLQWYGVMTRSSESALEAVAEVRVRLFQSKAEISFAEVSFRTFADKRLMDWFISQGRLKNKMPSVDGLKPEDDEDGNHLSLTEQVVDDIGLTPEEATAQKQLFARCRTAALQLPDKQRTALVLCVMQEMTHKQAAEVMGLSESSVQKYVKSALAALRTGDWHE
ncbi:RNA polymerase sigma factor [Ralstonia sp. Ralssp110]|uniref:RNA polymerase sigma factor n=1 Tax=Ralstonia sp. Ralssp110 TaxID=3243004 RepID=UPI0039B3E2C9